MEIDTSLLNNRLLELTNTISKTGSNKQVLDKLKVERERGITVKAQVSPWIFFSGRRYFIFFFTFIDRIHVLQL